MINNKLSKLLLPVILFTAGLMSFSLVVDGPLQESICRAPSSYAKNLCAAIVGKVLKINEDKANGSYQQVKDKQIHVFDHYLSHLSGKAKQFPIFFKKNNEVLMSFDQLGHMSLIAGKSEVHGRIMNANCRKV